MLTIDTLTLFLLKFFMKQTDGALKQDCRGVNNKHHAAERWDLEFVFQTPQKVFSNTTKKLFIKNHIIRFPSVQSNILVGFKISLSRESTIFRNEIEVFFFALTWRDKIEIIIRPFSYLETRTRVHIATLMFRDEIETFENHFSLSSEKK